MKPRPQPKSKPGSAGDLEFSRGVSGPRLVHTPTLPTGLLGTLTWGDTDGPEWEDRVGDPRAKARERVSLRQDLQIPKGSWRSHLPSARFSPYMCTPHLGIWGISLN